MEQIITALSECRKQIEIGLGRNSVNSRRDLIEQGAFGLQIMEIMLSEPKPELQGTEVHVIRIDGIEMPDPFNSIMKKFKEQIERMPDHKTAGCPQCGNEEISQGTKYCKICGLNLAEATPGSKA